MSGRRRTKGDETWNRLLNWAGTSRASERLAGHILAHEGFVGIDPIHPSGGPDGRKDLICSRDGISWVVAVYFPCGKQSFTAIRSKFDDDVMGAIGNNADGFVFVVNQRITATQRKQLKLQAPVEHVQIYHLDRIAHILDEPVCYGIRQEFLDIDMTQEEMIAFAASQLDKVRALIDQLQRARDDLRECAVSISDESQKLRDEVSARLADVEILVRAALSQRAN